MPKRAIRAIQEYIYIPITITIAAFVFLKVIVIGIIPTASMEPTYMAGSFFIGLRLIDRDAMERGTPVLFHHGDSLYIKRIIGLPGDTVNFQNGSVYIDGSPIDEAYLNFPVVTDSPTAAFAVPDNCYLMLGDNRPISYDARYWDNPYTQADTIVARILFTTTLFNNE